MVRKLRIGPLPPARRKRPPRRAPTRRPPRPTKPRLHIYSILAWADKHRERTGLWPIAKSGIVHDAPWDTWRQIDDALRGGYRGCRPGGSLAKLLLKYRGKQPRKGYPRKPPLSMEQVLAWADAFHERTRSWPAMKTRGPVADGRPETWLALDNALRRGTRGLPGDASLAIVLMRYRGVQRASYRPHLTIKQILAWADAYHARRGRWPSARSSAVEEAPDERWHLIHAALEDGRRGLPAGYTLATLLQKYRGHRYRRNLPPYTEAAILAWADAFHRRHGRWPTHRSGPIPQARGETWGSVQAALNHGRRGMPGGDSLSRLLMRHGRRPRRTWHRHPARHHPLTVEQILTWADAFYRRNNRWPATLSGPIAGTRDETWFSVDSALRIGMRSLPGRSSIALLLEKHRGMRHQRHRPKFTARSILSWADAFYRREGRWPGASSGPIPESPGDTWCAVEGALQKGLRGLPGRDSLFRFLRRRGRIQADHPHVKRPRNTTPAHQRTGRANLRPGPV